MQLLEAESLISEKQFLADGRGYSPLVFQHQRGDGKGGPSRGGLITSQKNIWDVTGYLQETESLKQEARMPEWLWEKLLLNCENQGLFWQDATSFHRLPTVLFLMWQSYQSKVLLGVVKYLARKAGTVQAVFTCFWQEQFALIFLIHAPNLISSLCCVKGPPLKSYHLLHLCCHLSFL